MIYAEIYYLGLMIALPLLLLRVRHLRRHGDPLIRRLGIQLGLTMAVLWPLALIGLLIGWVLILLGKAHLIERAMNSGAERAARRF